MFNISAQEKASNRARRKLICITELLPDVGEVVIKVLIFSSPHNSGRTEWSRYHANSHQLCFTGEKRREEKSEVCLTQKSESLQQRNPRRWRRRNAFMILIQFPPRHSNIPGNGNQSGNLFWKHFPLSPSETRFGI